MYKSVSNFTKTKKYLGLAALSLVVGLYRVSHQESPTWDDFLGFSLALFIYSFFAALIWQAGVEVERDEALEEGTQKEDE